MKKLIELRKEKKLTQSDLAEILGISRQAYSNYEVGKRQPDNEILLKLADYFNVTVDYLLGRKIEHSQKENPFEQIEGSDETNIEILNVCADLSLEAKEKVLSYIRFLKQDEENKHAK